MRLWFTLIVLVALVTMPATSMLAADKAPSATAPSHKFPAPLVSDILAGWNGLPWGTKLEAFQSKFPKAQRNPAGRWTTGVEESLTGIKGESVYGFNSKGQLNLVTFQPVEAERPTLRKKLIAAGVLREGNKPDWQRSGVHFVVADIKDGQIAVAVNAAFAEPSTKPATKPTLSK